MSTKMSNNTQLANQQERRMTFGEFLNSTGTKNLVNKTLGNDRHAQRFAASILSAVSVNPALQECDPKTILAGAFLGDSLGWTPSPQLGQFYLVPFNDKNSPYGKVAVFVPGYKGYIQLAVRSGAYKRITPIAVKEGEFVHWNPFTEQLGTSIVHGVADRDELPTVGYYIEFETVNGFRKAMYWTKEKMLNHADRYSPAFRKDSYRLLQEGKIPKNEAWKYSSFWYKDFDEMALKTMIRQCLPKWGPMSIDMQTAFDADEKVIDADGAIVEPMPELPAPVMGTPNEPAEPEQPVNQSKGAKSGKQVSLNDV